MFKALFIHQNPMFRKLFMFHMQKLKLTFKEQEHLDSLQDLKLTPFFQYTDFNKTIYTRSKQSIPIVSSLKNPINNSGYLFLFIESSSSSPKSTPNCINSFITKNPAWETSYFFIFHDTKPRQEDYNEIKHLLYKSIYLLSQPINAQQLRTTISILIKKSQQHAKQVQKLYHKYQTKKI